MSETAPIDFITAAEANDLIAENAVDVIDVRTPEEYAQGHIMGALNLPVDDIDAETACEYIPSKDTKVLLYCRSGMRSSIAADKLAGMGYRDIYSLVDGIMGWPFGVVS